MELEDFLQKYKGKANTILKNKLIGEVLFSEGTYEVEIIDPKKKENFWPFLQLDDDGKIRDSFCTCKESDKGFCEHLTAAYLIIFNNSKEPLHVRFKKSFWNALIKETAKRCGYEKKILLKKKDSLYQCLSKTKTQLFSIETKTNEAKTRLKEILNVKVLPTEETSIKFSNLTMDEISAYKEGRAPEELVYELSFWSDIAKWLMILQEKGKKYKIDYLNKKEGIPTEIKITFSNLILSCHIANSHFPNIIPFFNSVNSSLKLYEHEGKKISEIIYDENERAFYIKTQKEKEESSSEINGKSFYDWIYVEDVGFYLKEPNILLKKEKIEEKDISLILSKYLDVFEKQLSNTKIYSSPVAAKYHLFFDREENLHLKLYINQIDDFDSNKSFFFSPWAYIEKTGFYLITELMFSEKEKIILKKDVSEFITKHRVFLHNYPGFETHFGSLEAHLVYHFTQERDLVFNSRFDFPEDLERFIDFEDWVYVKSRGFYSKKEKRGALPLRPGLHIKNDEIAKFISSHKDELEQVANFFTKKNPIKKIGIIVDLTEEGLIVVKPQIDLEKESSLSQISFFENFAYLEKEGFFEIPFSFKFPERYEKEKEIPLSQESFFINYELDRLKPFIISINHKLKKPKELNLRIISIAKEKIKNRQIWLADLVYESEIGKVHAVEVCRAIQKQKKYLFSDAGLIILKEPRFNWLKALTKRGIHRNKDLLRLNTLEWIRLCIFEDLQAPKGKSKEALETQKLFEELQTLETDKILDISLLQSKLRPYQEIGVNWLWFLYCHNLSGMLCDDMGLGKTHQAMALIAAVFKRENYKFLVVCPTSVIYHWENLLKKFLPSIKVYVYHGFSRKLEDFVEDYDLLLTSYGIIRSEKEILKKIKFELAIFDEVQIAKNQNSLTHKALKDIHASMKLGLTGTPIENRLRELKTLFDLIIPNYFPSENSFREFFINPIERENDDNQRKLLSKLIKPFVLRRKKEEVLLDLPEKIEEISYCDLSEEQIKIYNEILSSSKESVIKEISDGTKPISYIHIFSLLTKLKQICDHPSLILKDVKQSNKHQSGKWELFVELLNEARDSNQKVVIFSQYLDMIEIIERYLKKRNIGFASIKGATKKRFLEIKRFAEDPKCEVFVASLLAAGVGIDLTAGSVVIHYDRWWNPAKENQATDRVHRIGQNRGVQVFKLVSKNTIEEHIHRIIEGKKGLIEEIVGRDEKDQIKVLSRDELVSILKQINID